MKVFGTRVQFVGRETCVEVHKGTSVPKTHCDITYNDMVTAQPFENTFDMGEIEGTFIKDMFEFVTTTYSYGRAYVNLNMLQLSGAHVVFNLSQPLGSRAQSIKIRCQDCQIPIYEDLDLSKTYRIIVPSFLTRGGDGFTVLSDNLKNLEVGDLDMDVFQRYLAAKSPIFQEIEGRITVIDGEKIEMRNILG